MSDQPDCIECPEAEAHLGCAACGKPIDPATPSEPEATVVEEWGVRWPSGEFSSCGWMPGISEDFARRAMVPVPGQIAPNHIAEAVVRRTRTTYADRVTEWTEADR